MVRTRGWELESRLLASLTGIAVVVLLSLAASGVALLLAVLVRWVVAR